MVCRRLAEPLRLSSMMGEFGRSIASMSRIISHTIYLIYVRHRDLIYFKKRLVKARISQYTSAVHAKGAPLKCVWAFIDGTRQYICRPSPRSSGQIPHENLQRCVYNGHPRKHCLNYQGLTTPDGLFASVFGPIEGRRHDSTILSISQVLDVLKGDRAFEGTFIYGDPAYGCSDRVCSPFPNAAPGSREAQFNSGMSSVREAVEWSFGRLKILWPTIAYAQKQNVRQAAFGRSFLVACLLSNCHCCFQPN